MDRRQVLRLLGSVAAATGLSPSQLRALGAPGARRRPGIAPFTPHQRATVDAIAELIIPRTDTPGARDAGVAEYVEVIVSEWYAPIDRGRFLRGLADVDARARATGRAAFVEAPAEERVTLLRHLEADGRAARARAPNGDTPFFQRIRALVLHGYYTSEVGMTEELLYRPLPGRYDGCVAVDRVARSTPGGR